MRSAVALRSLLLLGVLFPVGCASFHANPLPEQLATEMPNRFDSPSGFVMGAALPRDAEEVTDYYGQNLLAYGIVPVRIYFENRSQGDTATDFSIEVGTISYELPDGSRMHRIKPERVSRRMSYSQWRSLVPYFFAIFPGVIVNFSVSNANREMRADYLAKSLQDMNVPYDSGKTYRRVLFFRPAGDKSLEDVDYPNGILSIPVTPTAKGPKGSSAPFTASIKFSRS